MILDGAMLREATHPLEGDPRLIAAGRADRHRRPVDGQQMVDGDLRGARGLGVATRQDRADLPRTAEVRLGDPSFVRQ
ncbi:MAG: hypothetical protein WKF96_24060 [Solirubrobacteraceae bacterium]